MALTVYPHLREACESVDELLRGEWNAATVVKLSEIASSASEFGPPPADPFSAEYRDYVLGVWRQISGKASYDPAVDEACVLDPVARADRPDVYQAASSASLGRFLEAAGAIVAVLDAPAGSKLLEYGSGEGQIALHLARMGVEVSLIDIEASYLRIVELQAARNNIPIRTKCGSFEDDFGAETFDRVLFFEAFHHSLDHMALLTKLQAMTTPDAKVVLAAEPILTSESYWAQAVPYPWGPRLEGLSMRAMRQFGWLELGFQRTYFLHAAARAGWSVDFVGHANGLAHCYVLTKLRRIDLSAEIAAVRGAWHPFEGVGRWSTELSVLPMPDAWNATVTAVNAFPTPRVITFNGQPVDFSPLERRLVPVRGELTITCEALPAADYFAPDDTRRLGVFVEAVTPDPATA